MYSERPVFKFKTNRFFLNISKMLKRLKMKVNIIFFVHVYDARFGIKSHFIILSISRGFKIRLEIVSHLR